MPLTHEGCLCTHFSSSGRRRLCRGCLHCFRPRVPYLIEAFQQPNCFVLTEPRPATPQHPLSERVPAYHVATTRSSCVSGFIILMKQGEGAHTNSQPSATQLEISPLNLRHTNVRGQNQPKARERNLPSNKAVSRNQPEDEPGSYRLTQSPHKNTGQKQQPSQNMSPKMSLQRTDGSRARRSPHLRLPQPLSLSPLQKHNQSLRHPWERSKYGWGSRVYSPAAAASVAFFATAADALAAAAAAFTAAAAAASVSSSSPSPPPTCPSPPSDINGSTTTALSSAVAASRRCAWPFAVRAVHSAAAAVVTAFHHKKQSVMKHPWRATSGGDCVCSYVCHPRTARDR